MVSVRAGSDLLARNLLRYLARPCRPTPQATSRTAGRILEVFRQADVRVGFVVTAAPEDARQFVGPWADSLFVLCDPDKAFVKSLQLDELPALVHLGIDGTLLGWAQGWDPEQWRPVVDNLARIMSWKAPDIPAPGDPRPYAGAPALTSS